jgi:hypothetical protein
MSKEIMLFHYNREKNTYDVLSESGRPLPEIVDECIATHRYNAEITDEQQYKIAWKHRTAVNNLKNAISGARKQTSAVCIDPIKNACEPLENKLQELSDELTAKMVAFKPKEEKPKTTTIITIELPIESEQIARVKNYLKRFKIAYEEEYK